MERLGAGLRRLRWFRSIRGCIRIRRGLSSRVGFGRAVELAVTGAQAIRVIFQSLLGVTEDFIGRLDRLELGDELQLFPGVSIRMVFER